MQIEANPTLYAYTGGRPFDPARNTVVFIHGAQHDHSVWILQSRWFAHRGYSVLAFDLPGHCRSAGSAPTSVEEIADILARALDVAQVERCVLVGQSMGTLIALEVALRRPRLVAGIALVATAAPMKVSDTLLTATRDDPAAAMTTINVWSHSPAIGAFDQKPSNPGPGFSAYWQNLRLMQRIEAVNGPDVLARDFAACNAYTNGVVAAKALQCPALVIQGTTDTMTPLRSAQPLISAFAKVDVVWLDRVGHSAMAEDPEGVRRALVSFAERVFERNAEAAAR